MDKKNPPYNKGPRRPDSSPSNSRWPTRPRSESSGEKVNHNAYKPVEPKADSVWPDPQKFLSGVRPARAPAPAREHANAQAISTPSQTRPARSLVPPHTTANASEIDSERSAPVQRRGEEIRIYGRNACHAVFAKRSQDVRKLYLTEARLGEFKTVLAWCVQNRIGYRVVESDDLDRLTEAQHHEGVCFEVRRQAPVSLSALLQSIPGDQPALLIWLDGVGNPHNVGAMLRSAANFGVRGAILPVGAPALSGAAMRVAEGGAEAVMIAQPSHGEDAFAILHGAGFTIAATAPRAGDALYKNPLPPRLALILGAEGEGMSADLIRRADLRLTIPGSGAVESLNVSASAAVLFGEYWRQHCSG